MADMNVFQSKTMRETIRPGAAPSLRPDGIRVRYCARRCARPGFDDFGIHRMRLRSAGCDLGGLRTFDYDCTSCGMQLSVAPKVLQMPDPTYRLYVPAVFFRGRVLGMYGIPGWEPAHEVMRWVAYNRDAAPAGFNFGYDLEAETYMRIERRTDEDPPRFFDHRGAECTPEEFERIHLSFDYPVMVQREFGVYFEYPPDESEMVARNTVTRAQNQKGERFYVLDGEHVREEDVRSLTRRISQDVRFVHPDREVVREMRAMFETFPEWRKPFEEFERQLQLAVVATLKGAGVTGAVARVRALYELRDELVGHLASLLKAVTVPALSVSEERRRELLSMTPLGRAALEMREGRGPARVEPGETVLDEGQEARLAARHFHGHPSSAPSSVRSSTGLRVNVETTLNCLDPGCAPAPASTRTEFTRLIKVRP